MCGCETHIETETERKIDFKNLTHMTVEAGKSKIYRADMQARVYLGLSLNLRAVWRQKFLFN